MATIKDEDISLAGKLNGHSSFRQKEGDGFRHGISWRMTMEGERKDEVAWLYHAEKTDRQVKITTQGDPEGVIGHLSTVSSKNGVLTVNFVTLPVTTSMFEYLWDATNGEDEVFVKAAQGALTK